MKKKQSLKKPVPLTVAERKSLSKILAKARAFKAAYAATTKKSS